MMLKYFCFLLLACAGLRGVPITSFQEVEEKALSLLEKYEAKEILLVTDIHYSLLQPEIPVLYKPNIDKHREIITKTIKDLSDEEISLMFAIGVNFEPQRLVEANIPCVLQHLQEKGIKIIALTTSLTGKILKSHGCTFEGWLERNLNQHGINFSKSFSLDNFSFDDFPLYRNNRPLFHHGLILTNKASKGKVLLAFLKRCQIQPKAIIFIENNERKLADVEASLHSEEPTLLFVGLHYTVANSYAPCEIDETSFENGWKEVAHQAHEIHRENLLIP